MNLQDRFPEWYALVVPNFTPGQVAARLKASAAIAKGLKRQSVPQLVRMFYRLPVQDSVKDEVRNQLKNEDPQYVSHDEAELAIVAGAVIASKLKEPSHEADSIAMAVQCVEAFGLRKSERLADVVNGCRQYLVTEAVRVRNDKGKLSEFPDKSLTAAIGKVKEKINDWNAFSQNLEEQLLKLSSAISAQFDRIGDAVTSMERRRREESNILYWLFGEATVKGHTPYSEMSEVEAVIPVAYDLASLTEDLPGPVGARTFMRKMLKVAGYKDSSTASLAELINSLKSAVREQYLPAKRVDDPCLTPIGFGLEKAKESGSATDWLSAFKSQNRTRPQEETRAYRPVRFVLPRTDSFEGARLKWPKKQKKLRPSHGKLCDFILERPLNFHRYTL